MTARKKGGAKAPLIRAPDWKPAPLDPEARWREFEAKTAAIAEAIRSSLGLGQDVDLTTSARRYAMAAMSGERSRPWPPSQPTEQALKSELLRVEKAAKAMLKGRKGSEEGLINAVKAMSRDAQRALPEALFILAELPSPALGSLDRLARNALFAARVIPVSKKHPGGGRPTHAEADALTMLLAQDFATLTQDLPSASNWDRSAPELYDTPRFVALVEAVSAVVGIRGVARKSAERALTRATKLPRQEQRKTKTNKRT